MFSSKQKLEEIWKYIYWIYFLVLGLKNVVYKYVVQGGESNSLSLIQYVYLNVIALYFN